jgi:predicted AAA+ superfamily ATPase
LSLTEIAHLRGIELGAPFLPDNGLAVLKDRAFWHELQAHGRRLAPARERAFGCFAERGGYPLGHARPDTEWPELADQLNETVVRRVIRDDLRLGERGRRRDPALLEELFRLLCRYAGQAPTLHTLGNEARAALGGEIGDARVRTYLRFLTETLLVRAVEPLEMRLKRNRGGPKLCLVDHALRASWLQEWVPLDPAALARAPEAIATLAGHLAESTVGAMLTTIPGLDVNHRPARGVEPEIDFVLSIGTQRVPIEVKYQSRLDPLRDTHGLRTFMGKAANQAPFGLLVTRAEPALDCGPDVIALPLATLMLLR